MSIYKEIYIKVRLEQFIDHICSSWNESCSIQFWSGQGMRRVFRIAYDDVENAGFGDIKGSATALALYQIIVLQLEVNHCDVNHCDVNHCE